MSFAKLNISALAVFLCLGISMSAAAAVPATMTYHGELNDGAGQPVDTTIEATFRIFDAASDGAEAWSETFSTVDVNSGSFSVQLGADTPLDGVFDGNAYWLEVSINGETLSPRTPIESVPYALRANSAANADTVAGQTPADIIASASGSSNAGDVAYDNTTSGLSAADVQAALDELAALRALVASNQAAIATNTSAISSAQADITSNTSAISSAQADITANTSAISSAQADITANTSAISSAQADITANTADINGLETLTQDMARTTVNGKQSITFSGVNVHIRSGSGRTNGDVNGLGNLIVGYDEARDTGSDKRGSHNIVVGPNHNFTHYGGMVVGEENSILADYASITGGRFNIASGVYSTVTAGLENQATGLLSSVSGGRENIASGVSASVSGGIKNQATSQWSTVAAGKEGIASGNYSSITGGWKNRATGPFSSVTGGVENQAEGHQSTVSGGYRNTASSDNSTVSGGFNREASGFSSWVAGSLFEAN